MHSALIWKNGGVATWWLALCAIATLNVLAWLLTAAVLKRRRAGMTTDAYSACRLQLMLSAAYVFGCAFRSSHPVFDVPRRVLFNSWLSSVMVGRSVATIAELCFVAQWALMLRETGRIMDSLVTQTASRLLLPLIAIAEVCSWYSVLTTSNLGHVVEESLWALSTMLFVASMIAVVPRCSASRRPLFLSWCVAGAGYVIYLLLVDVPMYWHRWITDEAAGRQYLSFAQGLLDVSERRVVDFRWQDWKTEIAWMTLYFSVAVWISISLIYAALRGAQRRREGSEPRTVIRGSASLSA
jgi:hypothetical protein